MVKRFRPEPISRSAPPEGELATGDAVGDLADIQRAPILLRDRTGAEVRIVLDKVARLGTSTVVLGWATTPGLRIALRQGDKVWPQSPSRHARPDVAQALALPSADGLGFAVRAVEPGADTPLEIEIDLAGKLHRFGPLVVDVEINAVEAARLPELQKKIAEFSALETGSPEWRRLIESLPEAPRAAAGLHGFIEGVLASPEGDGLVFGWALHPREAIAWLEDGMGSVRPLAEAFRRPRRDIAAAFPDVPWATMESAFVAHLPGLGADPEVRLRAATDTGVVTLAERKGAERLPADPRRAAEKMFSIETEDQLFHRRAPLVDWPVLAPLIARRAAEIATLPVTVRRFGPQPEAPEISVIVPLFGRFDFIEHQLLEIARDPGFLAAAELIYVIDDPDIANDVLLDANHLWELYRVPFQVVWGERNRGFSGANNLGASQARGARLLFLNSDVIPIAPGWLEAMRAGFDAGERVGIVGARLLFPDGSLQHAGMEFRRYETLGIWTNYHPNAGTAPVYDPPALREVPAVTGACLMIPRPLFDEIGGWDTGYLIGDFEDSDLCLAARSRGYRVLYQPAACLTHLERQSFVGVGAEWFRNRMTICNAVRHQNKWQGLRAPIPEEST